MGDVIPFISRLVGKLDWSAGERARIQKLAASLEDGAGGIEVTFGRSDAGEPWCALTDEDGQVLAHVARIDGTFIVHHVPEDVFTSGPTLWAALEEALGRDWGEVPEFAEVVPLPLQARQTHLLSVLLVASVLLDGVAEPLTALAPPAEVELPPAPEPEAAAVDIGDRGAADGAPRAPPTEAALKAPSVGLKVASFALYEAAAGTEPPARAALVAQLAAGPAPAAEALPAAADLPAAAAAADAPPQPVRIEGTDGADTLIGTARAEVLQGGAGDDHLDGGGAETGRVDQLDGGAGNDTLVLTAQTVATGGEGADTFIIAHSGPAPDANLGVVLDFTPADGDRLTTGGEPVRVVSATPEGNVLANTPGAEVAGPAGGLPGYRLGVDTDSDGLSDGVVFVAGQGLDGAFPGSQPPPEEAPLAEGGAEPPLRLLSPSAELAALG